MRLSQVATGLVALTLALPLPGIAAARCVDVERPETLVFEGKLTHRIFPGPPGYKDVRRGDAPQPTYILELERPICAKGDDEFLDASRSFSRIHLTANDEASAAVWADLRRLIGQRVQVRAREAFGAHTGHHHAPLVAFVASVTKDADPTAAYGTAMTTIQGFYQALEAGNGAEASRFIIPEKRSQGPFSAAALSKFYGSLAEPLRLLEVAPAAPDEYRVRYSYAVTSARRCDGSAVVRTTRINGLNLIASIRSLSGC